MWRLIDATPKCGGVLHFFALQQSLSLVWGRGAQGEDPSGNMYGSLGRGFGLYFFFCAICRIRGIWRGGGRRLGSVGH